MREIPILMSAPMVRASLKELKTQTRRVLNPQPRADTTLFTFHTPIQTWLAQYPNEHLENFTLIGSRHKCPYGQPGDRLYVKEHAWMFCERRPNGVNKTGRQKWLYVPLRAAPVHYCEAHPEKPRLDVVHPTTGNQWGWRKKLGRFLPKWASRITLEVVNVRVERVCNISEADAVAEGIDIFEDGAGFTVIPNGPWRRNPEDAFRDLWKSIHGPDSWEANPWVWVIEFKKL